MAKPSDGAKKLIGDFAPKLVELTDEYFSMMFGNAKSCQNAIAA